MKTKRRTIAILVALGVLLTSVSPVLALPPLPSSFYGTVKFNGANAPAGTLVSAKINGVPYAYVTVQTDPGVTVYALDVPGDDASTPGATEGGVQSAPIVFLVDGVPANETGIWQSGTNVLRNLTVIPPDKPVVSIAKSGLDVLLTWEAVTKNTEGNLTVVKNYQVFRGEQPYFAPDPTPGTGNLVEEPTDLDYLHVGAISSLTYYYYIVRAANIAGPSGNSKRVGKFTFELVPGQ